MASLFTLRWRMRLLFASDLWQIARGAMAARGLTARRVAVAVTVLLAWCAVAVLLAALLVEVLRGA